MKVIVKTNGSIMLMLSNLEQVDNNRPSVVTSSDYLSNFISKGTVKVIKADLPDEASDVEFQKHWESAHAADSKQTAEEKEALAVDSFLSTLGGQEKQPEAKAKK